MLVFPWTSNMVFNMQSTAIRHSQRNCKGNRDLSTLWEFLFPHLVLAHICRQVELKASQLLHFDFRICSLTLGSCVFTELNTYMSQHSRAWVICISLLLPVEVTHHCYVRVKVHGMFSYPKGTQNRQSGVLDGLCPTPQQNFTQADFMILEKSK